MELKELHDNILNIFGIQDISDLPERLLDVTLHNNTNAYDLYTTQIGNLEEDELQRVYQCYLADRQHLKQDFTPYSLAQMLMETIAPEKRNCCMDICAGSGALSIAAWRRNRNLRLIAKEIDDKVIPLLLFNLCVRNIEGEVIQSDCLMDTTMKVYKLTKGERYSSVEVCNEPTAIANVCFANPPFSLPLPAARDSARWKQLPPPKTSEACFVEESLRCCADTCALILPVGFVNNRPNKEFIAGLIYANLVENVIFLPENMFESTSVKTIILVLNKHKTDNSIRLFDFGEYHGCIKRAQRGQVGGDSHTNRVYHKTLNTLDSEHVSFYLKHRRGDKAVKGRFCKISNKEALENDSSLVVAKYLDCWSDEESPGRSYEDIVSDINRIRLDRNRLKLYINETLARKLGFQVEQYAKLKEMEAKEGELEKLLGVKFIKSNYITFTKKANEFRMENTDKQQLSHILLRNLESYKDFVYYMNLEENRYLAELQAKILPDIMSGELDVEP